MSTLRQIVEEHKFTQQLEKRGISAERLDDLLEGIIVIVSRAPELFPAVPGTRLRRIVVNPFLGKALNLWFTYDDTSVTFLEIDDAE